MAVSRSAEVQPASGHGPRRPHHPGIGTGAGRAQERSHLGEAARPGPTAPTGRHGSRPWVLIVDRHRLIAEVLGAILEGEGLNILAPVDNPTDAMKAVRDDAPDLVLLDLGALGGAIKLGRRILEEDSEAKLVLLTTPDERRAEQEALATGFHGYMTKNTSPSSFLEGIRSVLKGQVVVVRDSPELGSSMGSPEKRDNALLAAQLTARERQVMALIIEGADNAKVARELSIVDNTVRSHIQAILTKLQVHSRLEALVWAVRTGLHDPG
jgi:two-component system, NarL family, nitrate/nitrite response regulator NarL